MKNLKTFIFTVIIAFFAFTSCTDDTQVTPKPEDSASIKTTLTQLRTHFDDNGVLDPNENPVGNILFDFCFDFVYPITLTYNTGAEVVVNDFAGLVDVMLASTDALYINGIAFPFQVETFVNGEVTISTINNEAEFITLLASCDFEGEDDCVCTEEYAPVCVEVVDANGETFNLEFPNACFAECEGFTQNDFVDCEDISDPIGGGNNCFELNYPLSVIVGDQTIVINNEVEFELFLFENTEAWDFVYPLELTITNANDETEVVIVNNELEFLEILVACDNIDANCYTNCPQNYDPVCVESDGFVLTFQNACIAECEGYTQADFIDCEPTACEDLCPTEIEIVCVEIANGEIIEFNNECLAMCAGYTPNNFVDCNPTGGCEDGCPTTVNPVCVEENGVITEFQNMCLAECAGYTQSDIVDCNPTGGDCLITDVVITVGDCISETAYSVTLNFNVQNAASDQFVVSLDNLETVGPFNIADLPVSFDVDNVDIEFRSLVVQIVNSNCINDGIWDEPNCSPTGGCEDACPTTVNPVCVETADGQIIEFNNECLAMCAGYTPNNFVDCNPNSGCWSFVYPITIESAGQTMVINNDIEFSDNFNPSTSSLVYPFDVVINGVTSSIITPNNFFEIGEFGNMCN